MLSTGLAAQKKAIEDARSKAEQLADTLGVNLGRVKTFTVADSGEPPVPILARSAEVGVGGAAPDVSAGTQEVQANVTVTFKLR